jgi:multiple antibiotic resistance protein
MISAGEIFTLFFVTLGPLKILGPFAAQTRSLDASALRGMAFRVFGISLLALALGGWLGHTLAAKWQVSLPALTITAGIIFFLVALRLVLEQYEVAHEATPAPVLPAKPLTAALQVTFPTVVTPYGIAALIALLAAASDMVRQETIWAILVAVMVLNLIAMLAARAVMHGLVVLGMRLLGAVLGVLQVALAVQIMLRGLHEIGVVS